MAAKTHPLFETPLPDGWKLVTTDDIKSPEKSSCVAGPFGSNISSKYFVDSGVPVIRGSSLRDDLTRFVPKGFVFVSEEQATKYKAQHVRGGDLVFTCWGTVGQVGIIPNNGPFPEYIISNKQLKLRPNLEISDPVYLFFYFAGPKMVQHVLGKAIGAAVPGINLGILKALPVVLPPLPVQRRIAGILSAYDELMQNSQRRIRLLEAMARALYREWFVHYRFPGHEKHPRVASPLGDIPQGWEVKKLGDLISYNRRATKPGPHLDERRYVPIDCLPSKSLALLEAKPIEEAQSSLQLFEKGDILFGSMRPYFHKVVVAPFAGVTRTTCFVFKPALPEWHAFATMTAFEEATVAYANAHSQGATIPYAVWDGSLSEMPLALPPDAMLRRFEKAVAPMLARISQSYFTLNNLRRTRDLLLPRLLAGQVNVT